MLVTFCVQTLKKSVLQVSIVQMTVAITGDVSNQVYVGVIMVLVEFLAEKN
jgi:hypothetical protein